MRYKGYIISLTLMNPNVTSEIFLKILKIPGGWANPLIADWFADYARVAYSLFGDRVKTWITINEALVVCEIGLGMGLFPPAIHEPGVGSLICNKNILMAHAKAYRVYDEEFRSMYQGKGCLALKINLPYGINKMDLQYTITHNLFEA